MQTALSGLFGLSGLGCFPCFFTVQLSISQQHSSVYSSSWQAQQTSRPHSTAAHPPPSMPLATYHSPLNPDGVKGRLSECLLTGKKQLKEERKQHLYSPIYIPVNVLSVSDYLCTDTTFCFAPPSKERFLISEQGPFCMSEECLFLHLQH